MFAPDSPIKYLSMSYGNVVISYVLCQLSSRGIVLCTCLGYVGYFKFC